MWPASLLIMYFAQLKQYKKSQTIGSKLKSKFIFGTATPYNTNLPFWSNYFVIFFYPFTSAKCRSLRLRAPRGSSSTDLTDWTDWLTETDYHFRVLLNSNIMKQFFYNKMALIESSLFTVVDLVWIIETMFYCYKFIIIWI